MDYKLVRLLAVAQIEGLDMMFSPLMKQTYELALRKQKKMDKKNIVEQLKLQRPVFYTSYYKKQFQTNLSQSKNKVSKFKRLVMQYYIRISKGKIKQKQQESSEILRQSLLNILDEMNYKLKSLENSVMSVDSKSALLADSIVQKDFLGSKAFFHLILDLNCGKRQTK